jgi:hypothetical protein
MRVVQDTLWIVDVIEHVIRDNGIKGVDEVERFRRLAEVVALFSQGCNPVHKWSGPCVGGHCGVSQIDLRERIDLDETMDAMAAVMQARESKTNWSNTEFEHVFAIEETGTGSLTEKAEKGRFFGRNTEQFGYI